jgi:hypothetical protein
MKGYIHLLFLVRYPHQVLQAAYLSFKVVVKQNVGGFDVTVYDTRVAVFMKVCKPTCRSDCNFQSCSPIHHNPSLLAYIPQNSFQQTHMKSHNTTNLYTDSGLNTHPPLLQIGIIK